MRVFQSLKDAISQLAKPLNNYGGYPAFFLKKPFVPPPEMPVDRRTLVRQPSLVILGIVKGGAGTNPDIHKGFDFGEELILGEIQFAARPQHFADTLHSAPNLFGTWRWDALEHHQNELASLIVTFHFPSSA
jgi:hypothetical protein